MNKIFLGMPSYKIQSEILRRNTIGRYVQSGLIAAYDGQANNLGFFHSNDKSKWRDCSGNGNDLNVVNSSLINVCSNCYEFLEPSSGTGAKYVSTKAINGGNPELLKL